MKGRIAPIVVSMLMLLGLVPGFTLYGQEHTEKQIDFEVNEQPLRLVLQNLANTHGLNLSFNASEPEFDQKISFSATQKTPIAIIENLLTNAGFDMQQIGNHFVIKKSAALPAQKPVPDNKTKTTDRNQNTTPKNTTQPQLLTDTIFKFIEVQVRDTIIKRDTVVRVELQTIRDTVIIEKQVQARRPARGLPAIAGNELRFGANKEKGWAISLAASQMFSAYAFPGLIDPDAALLKVKDSETFSIRNFGLTPSIHYINGKFDLMAGLSLNSFSNRFSYDETFTSGGFFQIDTLDVFYTIIGGSPVYTYVTDSTWIPLDKEALVYDRFNATGLLELQLAAQFTFFTTNDFSLYVKTGFHLGIPLWLKGNTISASEGYPAVVLNRSVVSGLHYGWQAAVGLRYELSNYTDLFIEPYYKRYIHQTISNYPLERRLFGFGLQLGFLYYF